MSGNSESPVLSFENISLARGEKQILRDVSWTIRAQEHWALIGANGSGKTTLLKLVLGGMWPTHGSIQVLGQTFGTADLRALRCQIGWVSSAALEMLPFQDTALQVVVSGIFASFHLYTAPPADAWQQARNWLRRMGCEELAERRVGILSQGEKQKVMIARALMASPRLLILDEPCTGLDLHAREELLQSLQELATTEDGPTLIYVTHHIEELFPAITHALALKEGQVLASGPKEAILSSQTLSGAFILPITVETHDGRFWPRIHQ